LSLFKPFFEFTDQFIQFKPPDKAIIEDKLVVREVPKGHTLVDLEQIAQEVYFINRGCMRFFYLTPEGKDITGFVFVENMFAGSHESFFSQVPSNQILETLEDCELLAISFEALHELYAKVPDINILVRKVLEMRMSHAQKVIASLIMNKPEDRYTAYTNLHPGIEQRIPQHILSSYMGITPVSLSRIRGRLSKKS